MDKRTFKRFMAGLLTAAMTISMVPPAYAGETEAETQAAPEASGSAPSGETEGADPGASVAPQPVAGAAAAEETADTEKKADETAETQEASSEEQGEDKDKAADAGPYILLLPEIEGVTYTDVDESHKSAEYSTSAETILLYEAGEQVSLGVDTDYAYSVYDKKNDRKVLESKDVKDNVVAFTMPASDLIVQFVIPDPAPETESKAEDQTDGILPMTEAPPQTEAQETEASKAEAETETAAEVPSGTQPETEIPSGTETETEVQAEAQTEVDLDDLGLVDETGPGPQEAIEVTTSVIEDVASMKESLSGYLGSQGLTLEDVVLPLDIEPADPAKVTGSNKVELKDLTADVTGTTLFHQKAEGWETIPYAAENGSIIFETSSFSPFVFAKTEAGPGTETYTVTPEEGSGFVISMKDGKTEYVPGEDVTAYVIADPDRKIDEVSAAVEGGRAVADSTNNVTASGDAGSINMDVTDLASSIEDISEDKKNGTSYELKNGLLSAKKVQFSMPRADVIMKVKTHGVNGIPGVESFSLLSAYSGNVAVGSRKPVNYIENGQKLSMNIAMDTATVVVQGSFATTGMKIAQFKDESGKVVYSSLAYCLQPALAAPTNDFKKNAVSDIDTSTKKNQRLYKIMYYGFRGPAWGETVNGINLRQRMIDLGFHTPDKPGSLGTYAAYCTTHYLLALAYDADTFNYSSDGTQGVWGAKAVNAYKALLSDIDKLPVPGSSISDTSVSSYWDSGTVLSDRITFHSSLSSDWAKFTVGAGYGLKDLTTGVTAAPKSTPQEVTVNAGDTFQIINTTGTAGKISYSFTTRYASEYDPIKVREGDNKQDVSFSYVASTGITLAVEWKGKPYVSVTKTVSDPSGITAGNGLYSIAGAQYTLTNNNNKAETYTFIISAEGTSDPQRVTPGSYTVEETVVPHGFTKSPTDPNFTVNPTPAVQTYPATDEPRLYDFKLNVKKDVVIQNSNGEDSGKYNIDKVIFEVSYYKNATGAGDPAYVWKIHPINTGTERDPVYTASLDKAHLAEGSAELVYPEGKLPLGYVKVREVSSPENLTRDTHTYSGSVEEKGNTDFTNVNVNDFDMNIQIVKKDAETGEITPDAELEIVDENGSVVDDWKSTADPYRTTKLVEEHKYFIREKKAPAGYVIASPVPFTVANTPDLQTFEIKDKQVFAKKVDEEGKALAGAEMSVKDKDGDTVDSWTTDGTDHAINGLTAGQTYTLYEDKAPEGYTIALPVQFTVDDDFKDQTVTMTDKRVVVSKRSVGGGKEVKGAKLTVTDKDNKIMDSWVSGDEPHEVSNLTVGETYTLSETTAAEGYVRAVSMTFTVSDDKKDQPITMIDEQVIFSKVGVTGEEEVPGAKIVVKDKDGKTVDEWISGKEPHAISGLEEGKTYTLSEDAAPAGYARNVETVEFEVSKDKKDDKITMKDKRLFISKTEITGKTEIKGAHLAVTDKDGKVVDEWVSGDAPHPVSGLEIGGKYTLTETKPADGYVTAESIQFEVTKDMTADQTYVMKDDITKLYISKRSITTGDEIPGAHLVIKDSSGNTVAEWDSTEEPHYIEMIPIGTYTLTETKPADGYATAETITFEVKDTAEIQHVEMFDDVTKLYISKQDITTKKELPGAKLVIKDSEGNEVESWTSTDEPHYIEMLPIGKYTLTEITAPDGYEKSETVKFEIADTAEQQHVVMYDSPIPPASPSTPQTGDAFNGRIAAIIAVIAAALAVLGIAIGKKSGKKKDTADADSSSPVKDEEKDAEAEDTDDGKAE